MMKVVTFKLEEDFLEMLRDVAREKNMYMSEIIREALKFYLLGEGLHRTSIRTNRIRVGYYNVREILDLFKTKKNWLKVRHPYVVKSGNFWLFIGDRVVWKKMAERYSRIHDIEKLGQEVMVQ